MTDPGGNDSALRQAQKVSLSIIAHRLDQFLRERRETKLDFHDQLAWLKARVCAIETELRNVRLREKEAKNSKPTLM